jgi:hypothetical protein
VFSADYHDIPPGVFYQFKIRHDLFQKQINHALGRSAIARVDIPEMFSRNVREAVDIMHGRRAFVGVLVHGEKPRDVKRDLRADADSHPESRSISSGLSFSTGTISVVTSR